MLLSKENEIGLDVLIGDVQSKLYNSLKETWNYDLLGFPRCLVNYEDNKKNIEFYDGENEYKTVLYAEDTKFFFTQENSFDPVDNFGFVADVKLYFIIDFSDINTDKKRNDYELLNDVVEIINNSSSFSIKNIETDFKNIFRNTIFIEETDNLQPYFSFMITMGSERFETNLKPCSNGC